MVMAISIWNEREKIKQETSAFRCPMLYSQITLQMIELMRTVVRLNYYF